MVSISTTMVEELATIYANCDYAQIEAIKSTLQLIEVIAIDPVQGLAILLSQGKAVRVKVSDSTQTYVLRDGNSILGCEIVENILDMRTTALRCIWFNSSASEIKI